MSTANAVGEAKTWFVFYIILLFIMSFMWKISVICSVDNER
jgi:hypothetical protein